MKSKTLFQKLARRLAASAVCRHGKSLYARNTTDWHLALTKFDKLWCGLWLILADYAEGTFPPLFRDQETAYRNEIQYSASIPGVDPTEFLTGQMQKPFWNAASAKRYLKDLTCLMTTFEQIGLRPGHRILELGCGSGWMSELLAVAGYAVTASTISPAETALGEKRIAALKAKGLNSELRFVVSPMEEIDHLEGLAPVDAAFVYEALHHAFDWRRAFRAVAQTLKPGGWFIIANEPNVVHTFVSYRIAKLSNTHEIGLSQSSLLDELRRSGFTERRVLRPRVNWLITPHWIVARKG